MSLCTMQPVGNAVAWLVPAMQISLVGHSAGAQLCTMALLHRAKALGKQQQQAGSRQVKPAIHDAHTDASAHKEDLRMPARLIGETLS